MDFAELRTKLFQSVKKELTKHTFELKRAFDIESVSVEQQNGVIKGEVLCAFCDKESIPIKVSLRSKYWILSNFNTHISRNHSATSKSKQQNSKKKKIAAIKPSNDIDGTDTNQEYVDIIFSQIHICTCTIDKNGKFLLEIW